MRLLAITAGLSLLTAVLVAPARAEEPGVDAACIDIVEALIKSEGAVYERTSPVLGNVFLRHAAVDSLTLTGCKTPEWLGMNATIKHAPFQPGFLDVVTRVARHVVGSISIRDSVRACLAEALRAEDGLADRELPGIMISCQAKTLGEGLTFVSVNRAPRR